MPRYELYFNGMTRIVDAPDKEAAVMKCGLGIPYKIVTQLGGCSSCNQLEEENANLKKALELAKTAIMERRLLNEWYKDTRMTWGSTIDAMARGDA